MGGGRPTEDGVYLLEFTVAGHVHRYASEAVEIQDASGDRLQYLEGLTEPVLSYGSLMGVTDATVGVELQAEVDWALLVARGHALDRAPAVLRRWYPGTTLERARVVIRGFTASPAVGALGETLALSVTRSMRAQTRFVPPAQAVVDDSTWPVTTGTVHVIPEKALAAAYPMVIGAPGHTEDATPVPCVPVPQAEFRAASLGTTKCVWLGGHANQVRVQFAHLTPPTFNTFATGNVDDKLGRNVQYFLPADSNESGEYLIGFRDDSTWGGGIQYKGALLRGAGDVLDWALSRHYAGKVDHGRLQAVRSYLNLWKIDAYINSPLKVWDWLQKSVLPLLPVEMREGAHGTYPAVIRYDLQRSDVVAHLDATPGSGRVSRASPLTLIGDIVNEVTVEYRPTVATGSKWLGRRIVTAIGGKVSGDDASDIADSRIIGSSLAGESQRRYGEVIPLRVQAAAVWDTSTAVLTGQQIVARRAWPSRSGRYTSGVFVEELDIGAAVTVTDPEMHLDEALAVVYDLTPGPEVALDLIVLDRPDSMLRATT